MYAGKFDSYLIKILSMIKRETYNKPIIKVILNKFPFLNLNLEYIRMLRFQKNILVVTSKFGGGELMVSQFLHAKC